MSTSESIQRRSPSDITVAIRKEYVPEGNGMERLAKRHGIRLNSVRNRLRVTFDATINSCNPSRETIDIIRRGYVPGVYGHWDLANEIKLPLNVVGDILAGGQNKNAGGLAAYPLPEYCIYNYAHLCDRFMKRYRKDQGPTGREFSKMVRDIK